LAHHWLAERGLEFSYQKSVKGWNTYRTVERDALVSCMCWIVNVPETISTAGKMNLHRPWSGASKSYLSFKPLCP
jgi:hypothetical protein